MIKIFSFVVVALVVTTQAFSQCACCAGAGTGSSNGGYNNGILTLKRKQILLEGYADYRTIQHGEENHHHSTSADTTAEEETPLRSILINSLGLRYGLTNRITLSALLPYAFLHTDHGNDRGIGDLIVMGTYNVFSKNRLNIAFQAGAELPTGIQKGSNFDNTTVVVGSGSVDPIAAIVFSKGWNKFTLQGNALYKHTTPGFGKNYYGSLSVQNIVFSYRLNEANSFCSTDTMDRKRNSGPGTTVFGGYYGEWLDNLKEDGRIDENSGYYAGFATMGTSILYKKWSFPLTVSIPLLHHMNGDQHHPGYRLRVGIMKSIE